MYVVGGYHVNSLSNCEVFNASDGSWIQTQPVPVARSGLAVVFLDNRYRIITEIERNIRDSSADIWNVFRVSLNGSIQVVYFKVIRSRRKSPSERQRCSHTGRQPCSYTGRRAQQLECKNLNSNSVKLLMASDTRSNPTS